VITPLAASESICSSIRLLLSTSSRNYELMSISLIFMGFIFCWVLTGKIGRMPVAATGDYLPDLSGDLFFPSNTRTILLMFLRSCN